MRRHSRPGPAHADPSPTTKRVASRSTGRVEELLPVTLDQVPLGFAITSLDGRFLRVNRWWSEITGYAPDELTSRSFRDITHASDLPENLELVSRLRRGEIDTFSLAKRYLHKSGRPVDVMIHASLVRDEAGRPLHYVTVVENITEKLRTERALRSAEEQFRLTIDQAPIGIALVSTGGSFLRVNQALCHITGYTQDELKALTFQDITHPDDLSADLALVDQLLAGSIPRYSLAKRYLHKDGHVVDIMLHVSLVRDDAGNPVHFVSQIEDVTERKRVQARLVQSERLASLGTLAGGVAHEVNNPLACIMSSLELLEDALRDAALGPGAPLSLRELEETLVDAQQSAERIRRIVRGLRTFSRGDEEQRYVVDVHEALESAATLVVGELKGRARIVRRYGPVPKVKANEGQLSQLFMNLLVNAAYSIAPGAPDENEVRIVTRADEQGRAIIEIQDTGPGIAASDLSRVFEPFFTTKPVGAGVGLGLSVAHGVVASLGGDIIAENRVVRGTSIRVSLPAA
jgi:PAS domain S-box-containing protein